MGFGELLLCVFVALIVLGPKRLPEAAKAAGKLIHKFRSLTSEVNELIETSTKEEQLKCNIARAESAENHD